MQLNNDEVASFTPARNLRPVYGAIGLSPIHLWSGGGRTRTGRSEETEGQAATVRSMAAKFFKHHHGAVGLSPVGILARPRASSVRDGSVNG